MSLDPLSSTLFALADPTRRAMLARLSKGEATVNELAAPFDISDGSAPTPRVPALDEHDEATLDAVRRRGEAC